MRAMREGFEKSSPSHAGRLWIGAPAVVMFATCVGAQAATQVADPLESVETLLPGCATPDLGWALKGGAACSVKQTRKALAHQATYVIHTLDRLSCARTCDVPEALEAPAQGQGSTWRPPAASLFKQLDPSRSTHQSAAP